jgi:chorismate lyase / 3-hydroxybenzoate synthase
MSIITASAPVYTFIPLGDPVQTVPGANLLGVVNYSTTSLGPELRDGYPVLTMHMVNTEKEGAAEVWTTSRPTESGTHNGISYAHDGEYIFAAGHIPASAFYTEVTREAYADALYVMRSLGYPKIVRMWNYIHRINEDNVENLEIYKDFVRGRAEAFEQYRVQKAELPAATVIGSLGGGIAFYFMASRSGVRVNIENPRQVAAYEYPRQYGPKSPGFARATYLAPTGGGEESAQIYISGTASILGHETMYEGDAGKQCQLALENIQYLVSASNLSTYGIRAGYELADLRNIKVYVKHREDMETVRSLCAEAFSPDAAIMYLNLDMCRADLLMELEGMVM